MYIPDQYSLTSTQRALVTYSNSATGEIRVKIPSVLGSTSEIFISKIGRKANSGVWAVPDVGLQIVVSYDDQHLTNVFWMQTDAVINPLSPFQCTSLTNPPAPYSGQLIFETDTKLLRIWNGTTWKAFFKYRQREDLFSCCIDSDWGIGIISKTINIGRPTKVENNFFEYNFFLCYLLFINAFNMLDGINISAGIYASLLLVFLYLQNDSVLNNKRRDI